MNAHGRSQSLRVHWQPARGHDDERGSALLVVLILALVMAGMLGAVISYLTNAARLEKRSNLRLESTYAAEYALEKAFADLKSQITQTNLPDLSKTTAATNLTTAPTDVFGSAKGYVWKTFLTVPTENGVVVGAHSNFDSSRGSYRYLSAVEFERQVPAIGDAVRVNFQREWVYSIRPLFKYAIFYDGDMELFPGADFVVGGRVHANGRIYAGTSASITYKDYVTHVNGVSKTYHDDDPRGKPTKPTLNAPDYLMGPPNASAREEPPGSLTTDLEDANYNNDGARELIEVPNSWQTDPSKEERLYNKAGLKVLVNSTASPVSSNSAISIPANSRVLMTEDGTIIPPADPLGAYLNSMFAADSVTDYRENKSMITTVVEVNEITAGYASGGLPATIPNADNWPNSNVPAALQGKPIPKTLQGRALWNGILYVADVTHQSTSHPVGVKIVNGSRLPDGSHASSPKAGLTIVTENAAYIVGDYNTGGTPPVNDNKNGLDAKNHVATYTVQPAAVIADAVTVLSSKWDTGGYDSKSLGQRTPVNTTINTALISGIVPTTTKAYSGGVENYIRLLENWSGDAKRLTYYGSIINLYASRQGNAPWQTTGNYYNAPQRNWYFDTQFRNPNRLPPGTPTVRGLQRGQWVQLD